MFKGWQQESAFPSWHDEPAYREKALAVLKAAVQADPARASATEALALAEGFAAAEKVDTAPPQPRVKAMDTVLQALLAEGPGPADAATIASIEKTITLRTMAQADPAPYFTGAQILIDRGAYDKAIDWAGRGAKASDHFIDENLSAYQMSGKVQSSYSRGRAQAADLAGWAAFLKKDYAAAAAKLGEAERLTQGADFGNQFHLGELARAQNAPARARERYLDALSLSGGPAPLRLQSTQALASIPSGDVSACARISAPARAVNAEGFAGWLEDELACRRDERKAAALKSLVDRPLPRLALTTVDGKPFDASMLKGKVVMLDFFASWCGICRQEMPHLKASYAQYQSDPKVAFLLVSIDEDDKRLQRYLGEMKFPFPVARLAPEQAEKMMGFDNVPATFYVDAAGIVRYQLNGSESHGDSPARVGWYIDQLKK
jgi:thiol-disulfide isomerase/thioredoxin